MKDVELDVDLTPAERRWKDEARRFAREVMRPLGLELDRLAPEAVVAKGSRVHDFARQAYELGFTRITIAEQLGGLGLSRKAECLITEELATGDCGLASILFLAPFPFNYALKFGGPELVEELAKPYFAGKRPDWLGSWSITEMAHGSDRLSAAEPSLVARGGEVTARLEGDHWILNGEKSEWISSMPIATHTVLFASAESGDGLDRGIVAVVPLDLAGVSRGGPIDKMGVRPLPQGSVRFENVRVPRRYVVAEPEAYRDVLHATLAGANAAVATLGLGVGRAAYEGALRFAGERRQGGAAIFEHQAVRVRLFDMFMKLQAARSLCRQVYVYNWGRIDQGLAGDLEYSCAAKVFTTDAIFEVADAAIQVTGARGLVRSGFALADGSVFHPEKLLRDAKAFKIADGENTLLELIGSGFLR